MPDAEKGHDLDWYAPEDAPRAERPEPVDERYGLSVNYDSENPEAREVARALLRSFIQPGAFMTTREEAEQIVARFNEAYPDAAAAITDHDPSLFTSKPPTEAELDEMKARRERQRVAFEKLRRLEDELGIYE